MKFKLLGKSAAEMPFLDHLEELRWRIIWSLLALLVCTMVAFYAVIQFDIIGFLMGPIRPYLSTGTSGEARLVYLQVTSPFFVSFNLALMMGIVVAAPIIVYQIWSFLSPALLPKEKRAIVPALYLGVVLFTIGVAVSYYVAIPFTIRFMFGLQTEALDPMITAEFYFGFLFRMLIAFGGMFEMPVVVMILATMGLVTSGFLSSKRRYAVAAMAIIAAMITPGDAITATVVMMGPLVLLYELSIGLAKLVERRREDDTTEALPEAT